VAIVDPLVEDAQGRIHEPVVLDMQVKVAAGERRVGEDRMRASSNPRRLPQA
jgi:hypothetical protein